MASHSRPRLGADGVTDGASVWDRYLSTGASVKFASVVYSSRASHRGPVTRRRTLSQSRRGLCRRRSGLSLPVPAGDVPSHIAGEGT